MIGSNKIDYNSMHYAELCCTSQGNDDNKNKNEIESDLTEY